MTCSSFLANTSLQIVADASAVINLIGSGQAFEIARVLPHPIVMTEIAYTELENGAQRGHNDNLVFDQLISQGLASRVSLTSPAQEIYNELVDGSTISTLDDGEAATIAYAAETQAIALIDERKARHLCQVHFPSLEMLCSAELFLHDFVASCLGKQFQAQAILSALQNARMRVPAPYVAPVLALIGAAADQCPSLPSHLRAKLR